MDRGMSSATTTLPFFHDGICVCTHGSPEDNPSHKSVAIDIYNNDLFLMVDDFIEADGGTHNIRVLRNRGFNAAHYGLSAQPVFGGPAYFIRNVVYHVSLGGALKFGGRQPGGCPRLSQYLHSREQQRGARFQCPLPQQPVSRYGPSRKTGTSFVYAYVLFVARLQRLSTESK